MTEAGHPGGGFADAPHGAIDGVERGMQRFSDSYGLVFALIVATLLASAFIGDVRWGRLIAAALMGVTFLLAFRASRVPGQDSRTAAVVVGVLVAGATIAAALGDVELSRLVSMATSAVFIVAASVAIVRRLRWQTRVTMRTVMGALCIYLFIGLFFAVVYAAVDVVDDGAFFAQTDDPNGVDFIYYSFITQATVGYGDLSPITDTGKMLAATEALLGQVYLVTIVAVMVSNLGRTRPPEGFIAGSSPGDEPGGASPAPDAGPRAAAAGGPSGPGDGGA